LGGFLKYLKANRPIQAIKGGGYSLTKIIKHTTREQEKNKSFIPI
jgi:hypothetical protein